MIVLGIVVALMPLWYKYVIKKSEDQILKNKNEENINKDDTDKPPNTN